MSPVSVERVLVFAPNWLGDAVMALPCLQAIRRHFPAASLGVASRSHLAPLFEMVEGANEVVPLQRSGRLGGLVAARRDARVLRGRFDVAILLPNSFRAAWIARRAGIAERWGYAADGRTHLLTRPVPRLRGGHQVEYYQRLLDALGIVTAFPDRPLCIPADATEWARATLGSMGWTPGDALVGMAPGAAYGSAKQWPPERFAQLAIELSLERRHRGPSRGSATEDAGARTVLVGSAGDRAACDEIARLVQGRAPADVPSTRADEGRPLRPAVINLAGATDLRQLAAVIVQCSCFVSNDSGAMHLAAALGVPVVAIFGSTNERETAPLASAINGVRRSHVVIATDVWCRPCMLRECPLDHACMTGIDVARVKAEVVRVIDQGSGIREQGEDDGPSGLGIGDRGQDDGPSGPGIGDQGSGVGR